MKTLRCVEIKWYCVYCKNKIVQILPGNPPAYCSRCDGGHENREVEQMAWDISNHIYIDELRKNADTKRLRKAGSRTTK